MSKITEQLRPGDATNRIVVTGVIEDLYFKEEYDTWQGVKKEPVFSFKMTGPSSLTISGLPTKMCYNFFAYGATATDLNDNVKEGDAVRASGIVNIANQYNHVSYSSFMGPYPPKKSDLAATIDLTINDIDVQPV